MPELRLDMLYYVESDRIVVIGRIEINDVIGATIRYILDNFFRQVAMRVHYCHSFARPQVLDDHIFEHG